MAQMGLLFVQKWRCILKRKVMREKATHRLWVAFVTRRADHLSISLLNPQQRLPRGEAGILLGRRQNAP